ncbi:MAG TPA: hypothetical protein PK765_02020 [bacterium]|nr:hypothetical protein [bacterium]
MSRRFKYLLAAFLALIVYETYLIFFYAYRVANIEEREEAIIEQNAELRKRIADRRSHLSYIRTNAYVDRVAKETQGLKNPGEEVFLFLSEEEYSAHREYDTIRDIVNPPVEPSPTAGMSNEEKWWYYLFSDSKRPSDSVSP